MTLDQLKTLVMVAETGSFHAASEKLYKSRPAVSIAIKNLEDELDFEIFTRETYRPELTSRGKAFYEKAKNLLAQSDDLKKFGIQMARGHEAEITLAVNAICPLLSIMTIIHLFQGSHPYTKLNLKIEYGTRAMEHLYSGEADLAVTEMIEPDPLLEAIQWNTINFLPVAAPSYDLARVKRELNYSDLASAVQIIILENTKYSAKLFNERFKGEYWTVSDFYVKKQMLLSALGWGVIPVHMIQPELDSGALVPLKIKAIKKMNVETYLLRKADGNTGPVSQEIWESLQ